MARIKSAELLAELDKVIPQVGSISRRFHVDEILEDHRYEFFAVPHSPSGFGDFLYRGLERTFKADWGKVRDSYDVPGPQVADRLRELRSSLASGSLELRGYRVTFDPSTLQVQSSKLKPQAKVMFEVTFVGHPAPPPTPQPQPQSQQAPAQQPPAAAASGAGEQAGKFCAYCGASLEPDARFCYRCGKQQPT